MLLLFISLGVLFIVGSIFKIDILVTFSTLFLLPTLILYYRYRAKNWFPAMVIALLLFYIRDLLMIYGFFTHTFWIMFLFSIAVLILYIFSFTSFQRSRVLTVEILSLVIMYGFLGFLFFSIAELVPQVIHSYKTVTYMYLAVLIFLLGVTFTQYLLKSHYSSLWLMLGAASLLVSELSLFFKMFVISDVSVNIFFPLFHVLSFYAFVEHAIHRRKTTSLPGF